MTAITPYNLLGTQTILIITKISEFLRLTPSTASLLELLSFRAYKDGQIFQSHESMARELGVSRQTIYRGLQELQKLKLIKIITPAAVDRLKGIKNSYEFIASTWKRFCKRFRSLIKMSQGKMTPGNGKRPDKTDRTAEKPMSQGIPYNIKSKIPDTCQSALSDIQQKFNASDEIMERAIKIAENNPKVRSGHWKFTRCLKGILKNIVPGYKENLILQEQSRKAAERAKIAVQQLEKETTEKQKIDFKNIKELIKLKRKQIRENKKT